MAHAPRRAIRGSCHVGLDGALAALTTTPDRIELPVQPPALLARLAVVQAARTARPPADPTAG